MTDARETGLPRHDGRVIVVTGASSGLGAQIARALDRAGASVALAARRADRLDEIAGDLGDAIAVPCDVTNEDDCIRLIRSTLDRFGRIDGLVNNAGATNIVPALRESTEEFRRMLEVNLVGHFVLARETCRAMRETGGGSIVNVSTTHAVRTLPITPCAGYTAAKAGLVGLTRELAVQWGRYNVRVNAIAPGAFPTEITQGSLEDGPIADWFLERIPAGRLGEEGDLDSLVLTLLHPGTEYITGQLFVIDGGLTIG